MEDESTYSSSEVPSALCTIILPLPALYPLIDSKVVVAVAVCVVILLIVLDEVFS